MGKILLQILLLLSSLYVHASTVTISGEADGYNGRRITVFMVEDYLSDKRVILATTDVNDKGSFILEFQLDKTREILLSIQRVEAVIFAEPGKNYEIYFPQVAKDIAKKFDRTKVEVNFENAVPDDLNLKIRSFNSDYVSFINEHYFDFALNEFQSNESYLKSIGDKVSKSDLYKKSSERDSTKKSVEPKSFAPIVHSFIDQMNTKYDIESSSDFLRDYIRYSLADLELLAGMDRKTFYREFFMSQRVQYDHPAYMSCFDSFYGHFLSNRPKEQQSAILKAVNVDRDARQIYNLFSADSTVLGDEVRSMCIIKGLGEIYFDQTFTRYSVERTLANFNPSTKEMKMVADNVYYNMKKCKEGWKLDDFTLADEVGEKWTLSEHIDAPTYLVFFTTWSSSSLKELQVMQNLYDKYGRQILFVAISMDDDYDTFRKYIEKHTEQKFRFVYGGGAPMLTYNCDVRTIPHALLLDSDGKLMYSATRKPSEGIQLDLDKMIATMPAGKQGPKTWKE